MRRVPWFGFLVLSASATLVLSLSAGVIAVDETLVAIDEEERVETLRDLAKDQPEHAGLLAELAQGLPVVSLELGALHLGGREIGPANVHVTFGHIACSDGICASPQLPRLSRWWGTAGVGR